MPTIRQALLDTNPWWKGTLTLDYKDRHVYEEIKKFMGMPQIISLTGLRRTGKTTLMHKIVYDYINSGFESRNIMYFSFDDFGASELVDILAEFESITGRSLESGRFLVLFDEIQKLNNWQEKLKRIYDKYQKRIKIVISGSESLFIRKRSKESLAGRIFEFKVTQLSLAEFLRIVGAKTEPIGIYENDLLRQFDEYTLTQGFPELIGVKDGAIIKKYVKENIVEKILYNDIPKMFEVDDPSILESMLNVLLDNPGQLLNVSEFAKELGIERHTCSKYLSILEAAFLVKKLYNFSRSARKTERKLKKYYPTVISTELLFQEDQFSRSKVFEWNLVRQINPDFFWRDVYKNEVDMVIKDNVIRPIEIKYGKIETAGVVAFLKEFGLKKGYILSHKIEDLRRIDSMEVEIIPAFRFLLKQGSQQS